MTPLPLKESGPESIKESRTLLSSTLFSRPSMSSFVQGEEEGEVKVDHTCAVINVRFNPYTSVLVYCVYSVGWIDFRFFTNFDMRHASCGSQGY